MKKEMTRIERRLIDNAISSVSAETFHAKKSQLRELDMGTQDDWEFAIYRAGVAIGAHQAGKTIFPAHDASEQFISDLTAKVEAIMERDVDKMCERELANMLAIRNELTAFTSKAWGSFWRTIDNLADSTLRVAVSTRKAGEPTKQERVELLLGVLDALPLHPYVAWVYAKSVLRITPSLAQLGTLFTDMSAGKFGTQLDIPRENLERFTEYLVWASEAYTDFRAQIRTVVSAYEYPTSAAVNAVLDHIAIMAEVKYAK